MILPVDRCRFGVVFYSFFIYYTFVKQDVKYIFLPLLYHNNISDSGYCLLQPKKKEIDSEEQTIATEIVPKGKAE